jgi:flavin-dependent dehydrogenase
MNSSTQVLVIGGGPAGSTASTLLAREGFDVTLVERDSFPRYHIGESLLPSCLEILDLTGAREKIEAHGFQRKAGGFFSWGTDSWVLDFAPLRYPYSFQVVRSEFDQLLLEHAKSQGVKVFEQTEITSLNFEGERPRSANWAQMGGGSEKGEIGFDYLIDASGRAGLMAMRYLKNRRYQQAFQNVALWGYWTGAGKMSFAPEGAIANGAVPDGWLWGIPLHNGTMSVGLVLHKDTFKEKMQQHNSLEQIYSDAIKACPLIDDLVKSGTLVTKLQTEQDYSYISGQLHGPGYFMIGDAAGFIDPLLSTGVHLATHSAMLSAASISSLLRGEVSEEQAMAFFEQSYRQTYLRLMTIVSGMYQQYDGKETYFWQAQQVTEHDYDGSGAMMEAWLYVVSGMHDVKEKERPSHQLQLGELEPDGQMMPPKVAEKGEVFVNLYNNVVFGTSMTPEKASQGIYVKTKPRLRLAFVEAPVKTI